jgi:hypothetical protein
METKMPANDAAGIALTTAARIKERITDAMRIPFTLPAARR